MNIRTNTNNTNNQACAACKYQRKKCAPDCILAPYFPHDRQRQFLNAHKLFGVRNITRIIEHLDSHDRDQAMRSIIFQSDMRAKDPVGGCYRYIQELIAQIEYHRAELELVLQQLAMFRAQAHHHQHHRHSHEVMDTDHLNLYNAISPSPPPPPPPPHYQYVQWSPQQEPNIIVKEDHSNNNVANSQDDVNYWVVQDSMSLSSLSLQNKNSEDSAYMGDELYNEDHKPSSSMLENIHCDEKFRT